jgi:dolichyl-phosphate beta-glucosyltransferase
MNFGLIVPCFNEAKRFNPKYWEEVLKMHELTLFFVDDGSTDSTFLEIQKIQQFNNCHTVRLETNVGKANAIRHGMKYANEFGHFSEIGFIDADGAFEFDDIKKIFEIWKLNSETTQTFDSLWSSRVKLAGRRIERNEFRHYIARIFATYLSTSGIELPYDTQSGFKIFKNSENLKNAIEERFVTRWYFDLELLSRILKLNRNYIIHEEPLNSWRDIHGSKINSFEKLRIIKETLFIRKCLKRL